MIIDLLGNVLEEGDGIIMSDPKVQPMRIEQIKQNILDTRNPNIHSILLSYQFGMNIAPQDPRNPIMQIPVYKILQAKRDKPEEAEKKGN